MTKDRIERAVVMTTFALFLVFLADILAGYAMDKIAVYTDVCTVSGFERIRCPKFRELLLRRRVAIRGDFRNARPHVGFTCQWMTYRSYSGLFPAGIYAPHTCWIL